MWAGCSTPPLRAGEELCKTPCTLPLLSPAGVSEARPLERLWAHPSYGTGQQQQIFRNFRRLKANILCLDACLHRLKELE